MRMIILLLVVFGLIVSCRTANQKTATSQTNTLQESNATRSIAKGKPKIKSRPDDQFFALMQGESIGALKIGLSAAKVTALLGVPESKTKPELWAADDLYHQAWSFPRRGITVGLSSATSRGKANVESVTVEAPSKLTSKRGVRIGSPESAVRAVYGNEEERDGQKLPGRLVAGSIYGGLIFTFVNGRLSEMFLGAAAE